MNLLLRRALERLERGRLTVTTPGGQSHRFGSGGGPEVAIRITDAEAERWLTVDPALKLGELYVDGRIQLEAGDCYDLIAVFKKNARRMASPPAAALQVARYGAGKLRRRQTDAQAKHNIAHHYDLDERFYRLFLDEDMQYTCAYFEDADQSLAAAQLAKKRHVAAKLCLEPGQRVLDIGCGWGGLAMYLAQATGARATGVTLSAGQHAVACRRARETRLTDSVDFLLSDYQQVQGTFDRLVSVGMFEAIGLEAFDTFFQTASRLMAKRGVFVLHSIGRTKPNPAYNPWLQKYIFPGSYIPALSEVLPAVERAGFQVTDVEILRLHYAKTLQHWRSRFLSRREEVLAIYDERFLRMWEFYLAGAEAGFRIDRMFIFQLQLSRPQHLLPLDRGYIAEAEARLRTQEAALGLSVT